MSNAAAIVEKRLVQSSPAGVDLLASSVEMHLDAVAVVFDFVKPLFALRRLGLQRCELGFNEPRHGVGTLWQ